MDGADVALIGALIVAFALVSRVSASWPLTMPMVFVGLGAALSATGALEVEAGLSAVGVVAEVALAVILFSDAIRIDLRALRREALVPTRLLLVGLPLSIVLGTTINSLLFPAIPLVEVALLAAILAPTDAALGAAVVEDQAVPLRERLTLNVESGLNDGLVVPIVTVLTVVAVTGSTSASDAVTETVQKIGFGVGAGVVLGFVAKRLLSGARSRGWSDGRYEQIATFVVPIVAYTASEALGGAASSPRSPPGSRSVPSDRRRRRRTWESSPRTPHNCSVSQHSSCSATCSSVRPSAATGLPRGSARWHR